MSEYKIWDGRSFDAICENLDTRKERLGDATFDPNKKTILRADEEM